MTGSKDRDCPNQCKFSLFERPEGLVCAGGLSEQTSGVDYSCRVFTCCRSSDCHKTAGAMLMQCREAAAPPHTAWQSGRVWVHGTQ